MIQQIFAIFKAKASQPVVFVIWCWFNELCQDWVQL